MRLDAPVTATSRVRSVIADSTLSQMISDVAGSKSSQRTVTPARSAKISHGRTLASWSRRETTISSPGRQLAATARPTSKVSAVALRP